MKYSMESNEMDSLGNFGKDFKRTLGGILEWISGGIPGGTLGEFHNGSPGGIANEAPEWMFRVTPSVIFNEISGEFLNATLSLLWDFKNLWEFLRNILLFLWKFQTNSLETWMSILLSCLRHFYEDFFDYLVTSFGNFVSSAFCNSLKSFL